MNHNDSASGGRSASHNPDDPDFPHGTTSGYKLGCRCEDCREAKRKDWREYKARQLNPMEDFEGQMEPNQIAEVIKELVLKIRCDDCNNWHEINQECPN